MKQFILSIFICAFLTLPGFAQPVCDANFTWTANPSAGCTINFSNTSTGGVFPSYYWDFGDGNTSFQTNPTHTYSSSGSYTVTLNMVDSSTFCFDAMTQVVQANCTSSGSCVSDFGWYVDTIRKWLFDSIL